VTQDERDLGVGIAILNRFVTQTQPRLLELEEKVNSGERLDDWDIEFLQEVLHRTHEAQPFVSDDPVSLGLYAKAVGLYKEITEKGLANEKSA
jgi:hypothetical protein